MIEIRQTKRGRWRAYEVERRALMSWRGDNFHRIVVRDDAGTIVERASSEEMKAWLAAQRGWKNETAFIVRPGEEG